MRRHGGVRAGDAGIDLDGGAIVAAVAFDEWNVAEASCTFTSRVAPVDPPVRNPRGAAELAGVLQLLREHALEPELTKATGRPEASMDGATESSL